MLVQAPEAKRDQSNRPVFALRYDEYGEFKECVREISFVSRATICDLETGAELTWRVYGEEVDDDAMRARFENHIVSVRDLDAQLEEPDAEEMRQGYDEFQRLPASQQLAYAAGLRGFADAVKSGLHKHQATNPDAVVTEKVMQEITRAALDALAAVPAAVY